MSATTNATATSLATADGLRIYDLDPQAAELWAVAGPHGIDPTTIDPDSLPEGFRWVEDDEWAAVQDYPGVEEVDGPEGTRHQVTIWGAYVGSGVPLHVAFFRDFATAARYAAGVPGNEPLITRSCR